MRIPRRFIGFLGIFQSILFLVHVFLYETWTFSAAGKNLTSTPLLKITMGALSVSFLFFAAAWSWIIFGIALSAGWHADFHRIVEVLFGAALLSGIFGVLNASLTSVRRITVRLENL